jgi:hypothetical protein
MFIIVAAPLFLARARRPQQGGPRPFIRVESRFVNIAMTGAERQARKIARLKEQAGAARGLVGSTGLMAAIHRRAVHTA